MGCALCIWVSCRIYTMMILPRFTFGSMQVACMTSLYNILSGHHVFWCADFSCAPSFFISLTTVPRWMYLANVPVCTSCFLWAVQRIFFLQKSEITMEVGGWVSEFCLFVGKSSQINSSKPCSTDILE